LSDTEHSLIINAFQPAQELDEPGLFTGRAQQVKALCDALHGRGTCPIIYGDRGLGKSSLALQMRRVAMGDLRLLASYKAESRGFMPDQGFVTFYIPCTDAIRDRTRLLRAMISAAQDLVGEPRRKELVLVDRSTKRRMSLKAITLESTRRYEQQKQDIVKRQITDEERLALLCETIATAYGQRVLFIVDELDRVRDKSGLASFLKSFTTQHVKFLLVGIAHNISDLLTDHASLERRLVPVRVPRMPTDELMQIVDRAMSHLQASGLPYDFEPQAKSRLARIAGGFPWFVHVLGQAALLEASGQGERVITEAMLAQTVLGVVHNQFAQKFSDDYQNAVRDSAQRETVLRAFAHWDDSDIPTRDVYRVLRNQLDVKNPSQYRHHLCSEGFGRVLITPSYQQRGLVRFRNEMFKVYVRLRPSLYGGTDEEVEAAFG
jgi:hypothetical protein